MGINSGNGGDDETNIIPKLDIFAPLIQFKGRDARGYPDSISLQVADDEWEDRMYRKIDNKIIYDIPLKNTDGIIQDDRRKMDLLMKYPDNVRGPFSDYKLDKLGGSTDWQTYYEVNGRRISEEDYLARREAEIAGMYGMSIEQYRKSLQLNHENILSVKNAKAWLQSSLGASKRAVLSPERAAFVAENIPFEVLLSLSDTQIEALRDMLTSFDILRPESVSQLQERLKLLWPESQYFQNDSIDSTQAGVYKSILHNKKLDSEIPYEVSSGINQEDMYVLAKIRASMLQGDTKAETVFSYFLTGLQERKNQLKRAAKKREEAYNSNRFLPDHIIQILNPNEKKQYIYDIYNELSDLYESPETLHALGMIAGYRQEFQALQKETEKKAQMREAMKAKNQDTLGGTLGTPDETITKKTKAKIARKKKQGGSGETPSSEGDIGAQETGSVEIGDSSRGSQMIRYLNGKQQFSLDSGKNWEFFPPQVGVKEIRKTVSSSVGNTLDNYPAVVLKNPKGDEAIQAGQLGASPGEPVLLKEPGITIQPTTILPVPRD